MSNSKRDDLVQIFVEEATELLTGMEADLVALHIDPTDSALVEKIFRAAHTIKGGAGIVGLEAIRQFTQIVEDLLNRVRSRELAVEKELISILLRAVDELKHPISSPEHLADESLPTSLEEVAASLRALSSRATSTVASAALPGQQSSSLNVPEAFEVELRFKPTILNEGVEPLKVFLDLARLGEVDGVVTDTSRVPTLEELDPSQFHLAWIFEFTSDQGPAVLERGLKHLCNWHPIGVRSLGTYAEAQMRGPRRLGETLVDDGKITIMEVERALGQQRQLGQILLGEGLITPDELSEALEKQSREHRPQPASSVRLEAAKLDQILNLMGECVNGHTRIAELSKEFLPKGNNEFLNALGDLDRVACQLRDHVINFRKVSLPIDDRPIFNNVMTSMKEAQQLEPVAAGGVDLD